MSQGTNRGLPLWGLGVMIVLLVAAVILFTSQQQANTNANKAATAQVDAQVAQSTAVAQAQVAVTEAQQASEALATQQQAVIESAATAAAAESQAQAAATSVADSLSAQIAFQTEVKTTLDFQTMSYSTAASSANSLAATAAAQQTTIAEQEQQVSTLSAQSAESANQINTLVAQAASAANQSETSSAQIQSLQSNAASAYSSLSLTDNYPAALLYGAEASLSSGTNNSALIAALSSRNDVRAVLNGHKNTVYALAYSTDSKLLATAGRDTSIVIWDTQNHQPIGGTLSDHSGTIFSLAFSPDGKLLASGSSDGVVILWDVEARTFRRLLGHTNWVNAVAFSPDGKLLASGSADKSIILWDVQTGEQVTTLNQHTDSVRTLAFSPDGTALASGSSDNSIILWNVNERAFGRELSGHTSWVNSLAFSPDGKSLVSGSADQSVRVWDVRSGEAKSTITGFPTYISSVAYSPDGTSVVIVANTVQIYDVTARDAVQTAVYAEPNEEYQPGDYSLWTAVYSPDGLTVAVSERNTVALWNPAETERLSGQFVTNEEGESVYDVAFSPDGKSLVSAVGNAPSRVWDIATRAESGTVGDEFGALYSAYSPNGKWLALAFDDVILVDPATGEEVRRLTDTTSSVKAIAFSPDSSVLAEVDANGMVHRFSVDTGAEIGDPLQGDNYGTVYAIAYSPDGRLLVTAGGDTTIHVWDAETGQPIGEPLQAHVDAVTALAFSVDGKWLATGSWDQQTIIWDTTSWQPAKQFRNDSAVWSVAFSPNGRLLANGLENRNVVVWDTVTQAEAVQFSIPVNTVEGLAFSPDGSLLAAAGTGGDSADALRGVVKVWDMNAASWRATACDVAGRNLSLTEWQNAMGNLPYRRTCENLPIDNSVIEPVIASAESAAKAGDLETAQSAYQQALTLLADSRDAGLNNNVCWYGSLYGFAELVLPACERAVELSGGLANYRDSRGLARALTGDLEGAIPDFQAYSEWSSVYGGYDPYGAERDMWITKLTAGQNPFDDETLKALLEE